ncbi:hypothetical protein [Gorillibacterium sp. CAU 1737]|uniref:hypothetical protein n=1 Tax=Gorillibacterium sp. CAU 1737 TaxID=3140362 RepID=UPI00326188B0
MAAIGNDLQTLDWVNQHWDLPAIQSVESIRTPHGGVLRFTFSDETIRFLKRMEDEERIHTTVRITEMLALHGVLVAEIVQARDGQWGVKHEEAHYL